jgi:hypothetical protein
MVEHDEQLSRSLEQPAPAESENIQASAGRRRFLKGLGIGLPAVMTLRSGALLAGTSSMCIHNANVNPSPPSPPKFNTPDEWFRSNAIQPQPITYHQCSNSSIFTDGTSCYNSDGSSADCSNCSSPGNDSYYSLCYVNDDGTVINCNPNVAGNPVSTSCAVVSFGL